MVETISGPGCLYVESRISKPGILDEKTYLKWYDEDHIVDLLQISGIGSARVLKDVNPDADKPYLVLYPLDDLGIMKSDDMKNIKARSDLLPGTGNMYDLADFDSRFDSLIQVYDPTGKGKGELSYRRRRLKSRRTWRLRYNIRGHTRSVISVQIQLKEGGDVEDFDRWYREEHLGLVSKATGYLRTTRFKLVAARTNSQARASQGLPTTDEPETERCTWLGIHEFAVENPDLQEIRKLTASPWTDRIYEGRKLGIFRIYKVLAEFGEKDWFHGLKV
ncbi:putative EthD domain-containing protein [Seiridium cardinale]